MAFKVKNKKKKPLFSSKDFKPFSSVEVVKAENESDNTLAKAKETPMDFNEALEEMRDERLGLLSEAFLGEDKSSGHHLSKITTADMLFLVEEDGMAEFMRMVRDVVIKKGYDFTGKREVLNMRSGRGVTF